jgi:hypothetical protein
MYSAACMLCAMLFLCCVFSFFTLCLCSVYALFTGSNAQAELLDTADAAATAAAEHERERAAAGEAADQLAEAQRGTQDQMAAAAAAERQAHLAASQAGEVEKRALEENVAVLQAAVATLTLDLKTATDRAAATCDTVPSTELEAAVAARDVAVTSAETVGGSPSRARCPWLRCSALILLLQLARCRL